DGVDRPAKVNRRIHQIDCTPVVKKGLVEHSYYLTGKTNFDIRQSINSLPLDHGQRRRKGHQRHDNVWTLR
ncbi:MAG: hypothetical protein V3T00_05530, partial [bacterium]